jgi:hypothetical protein
LATWAPSKRVMHVLLMHANNVGTLGVVVDKAGSRELPHESLVKPRMYMTHL